LAAKILLDLGFSDVTAMDMRIDEWTKASYPLVKKKRGSRGVGIC